MTDFGYTPPDPSVKQLREENERLKASMDLGLLNMTALASKNKELAEQEHQRAEDLRDLCGRLAEELDHLSWSLRAQELVQEAADAGLIPEIAARLAETREKGVK